MCKTQKSNALAALLLAVSTATSAAAPPTADDATVATIAKQTITARELTERTAGKLADQQKTYEKALARAKVRHEREQYSLREQELQAMLDERALTLEARQRNSTPAALIAATAVKAISEDQARQFYEANKQQIGQPYDQVAPMLKDYLLKQSNDSALLAYKAQLRTKYVAVVTLEPLREPVDASGAARGPAHAPVTLVEFSDFECPFCAKYAPIIKEVMAKYPTQVRLVYRYLPLTSIHPNAQRAAEAGECARAQGKFWEMHDLMFAEQATLTIDGLRDKARRAGLDAKTFDQCLSGGIARPIVERDVAAADELGIAGTPATFVNGRFLDGAVSGADLTAMIEDELHRISAAPGH